MMYLLEDDQLQPVWNAIRSLTKIRELTNVIEQGIVLTEAQALLVRFVFELEPLCRDGASPISVEVPVNEIGNRSGSPLMENAQPITPRPAAFSCKNRRSTGSASRAPPIANARERLSFFAVALAGIMSQIHLTWFHPHIPQGISAPPAQSRNGADRHAISKRNAPRKGHRTCG